MLIELYFANSKRKHREHYKVSMFRNELDTIRNIEDNIRGYHDLNLVGLGKIRTDKRVRFHQWDAKEVAVLERLRLLTSKPIVYTINVDYNDLANVSVGFPGRRLSAATIFFWAVQFVVDIFEGFLPNERKIC